MLLKLLRANIIIFGKIQALTLCKILYDSVKKYNIYLGYRSNNKKRI